MKKSPTPNPVAKVTAPQAPVASGQPKPVGVPTSTPKPAAPVTAPQAPAPVGQPKPVGVPTSTPKPAVAAPVAGVPHKQVNTANAATAGAGNSTGNKVGVIEPPTVLIRSKSTPSVSSLKGTQSNAGGQPMQRSKSQTVDRAHTRMGSVANKAPVGYSYSAGPGFRSRRPLDGIWHGELPSHFAQWEIRRLGKRFRKLDMDNSGALSVEEFMSLPELQQNPCVQRVLDIFDADGNGEIDFKEFIHGISQFSVKGDKESKLKFAFRLYDMDKDGYISNGELFQVLKMMVGNNLKDGKLQQIVDKTILYADKDRDGKISFKEFCAVVGTTTDVHKKMIVEV